jgi:hypothetical protein
MFCPHKRNKRKGSRRGEQEDKGKKSSEKNNGLQNASRSIRGRQWPKKLP